MVLIPYLIELDTERKRLGAELEVAKDALNGAIRSRDSLSQQIELLESEKSSLYVENEAQGRQIRSKQL